MAKHNTPLDVRDYTRKKNAFIRHQNRHGSFEYSPGTDKVRIAEIQADYRDAVAARYQRRFGTELDMSRLHADHPIDMIAGGSPAQQLKMRSSGINQSFGSQIMLRGKKAGLKAGDRFRIRFDN